MTSCYVLRCSAPGEKYYRVEGFWPVETLLCDAHFEAIEGGAPWRLRHGENGGPHFLMGRDLPPVVTRSKFEDGDSNEDGSKRGLFRLELRHWDGRTTDVEFEVPPDQAEVFLIGSHMIGARLPGEEEDPDA